MANTGAIYIGKRSIGYSF